MTGIQLPAAISLRYPGDVYLQRVVQILHRCVELLELFLTSTSSGALFFVAKVMYMVAILHLHHLLEMLLAIATKLDNI
jgi:hypothetical protein